MKVHLIKKQTIEDYANSYTSSKIPLAKWLQVIKDVDWETPEDILNTYGSADLLGKGSNRVVFNIGGNNYRLICGYHFREREVWLFVKWIGSHAEYTRLCQERLQFTVSDY